MALKQILGRIWDKDFNKRKSNLDNESREISLQTRQRNAELKKIRQDIESMRLQHELEEERASLDDLKDELYGVSEELEDGELSPDNLLMQLLQKFMMSGKFNLPGMQTQKTIQTENAFSPELEHLNTASKVQFTDEEIDNLISMVPKKYMKQVKKMDDVGLRKVIHSQIPNCQEETIERIITKIR